MHLPRFHVVVCPECWYAVLPSTTEAHFSPMRPHASTKETRMRMAVAVGQINELIQTQDELRPVDFPFPGATALLPN